jgi:hypothetical protein
MKIAHVLNMANNGYHMVKALRNNGVDVDLIISSTDFGMALPIWEENDIKEDPYKVPFNKLIEKYELPQFVKVWTEPEFASPGGVPTRTPKWLKILGKYPFVVPDLYNLSKKYDLLHLHPPSSLFLYALNKPKIIHESGWIRKIMTINGATERIGRRTYETAEVVVWTNPDTHPLLEPLDIKRLEFVPFVIDPNYCSFIQLDRYGM